MISKKRPFRRLTVACAVLSLSSSAFAKDAPKKKDAAAEHKGGMMEEGGKDPAETETMEEDGAFVPGKKKPVTHAEGEEGAEGEEESTPEDRAIAASQKNKKKEEEAPAPKKPARPPHKTLGIFGEFLYGFGEAPLPGPGDPYIGKSSSFAFLVGGHYDLTTALRLSLRLPWTTGTVPTNNSNKDTSPNVLGNPEMAARYRFTDPGDTEVAVKVAVGIPVAQGNPDVTEIKDTAGRAQDALQRVANAANGWHDPELYSEKRLPVTPSVTISQKADAFRAGGEFKAIFLPKIGGNISQPSIGPAGSTFEMKSLALTLLLGGSASYEVLEKKFIALALWGTYRVADTVEYTSSATAPTRLQFVMEPKILAQFGHFVPAAGFLIPLGGQLGGHINGLRIHVDAVF